MKKIYIAVLLLFICAGVCIFEQTAINNVYSNTNDIIDCALNYSKRKDFANSKKECIKLNEYWNKKYIFLSSEMRRVFSINFNLLYCNLSKI